MENIIHDGSIEDIKVEKVSGPYGSFHYRPLFEQIVRKRLLKPREISVLSVILQHAADGRKERATLSYKDLAKETCMDISDIGKAARSLVSGNLIEQDKSNGKNRPKGINGDPGIRFYRVNMTEVEALCSNSRKVRTVKRMRKNGNGSLKSRFMYLIHRMFTYLEGK